MGTSDIHIGVSPALHLQRGWSTYHMFYSKCPCSKNHDLSISVSAVSRLPCCGWVWKVGDLGWWLVGMREQDNLIPGSRGHDRADILYGPPQSVCGLHTDKIHREVARHGSMARLEGALFLWVHQKLIKTRIKYLMIVKSEKKHKLFLLLHTIILLMFF
jgi:hypothetical protein